MVNNKDGFDFMRMPADFYFNPDLVSRIDRVQMNSYANEMLELFRSSDLVSSKKLSRVKRLSAKKNG